MTKQEIQLNLNRLHPPTQDITNYDIRKELRTYLMSLFPDIEIKRGQINYKAPPKGAFIIFYPVSSRRLSTNRRTYTDTYEEKTQNTISPMEVVFQVDFYGVGSSERVHQFATLFEDHNGFDCFPENIKPLFCTDPVQMPLTNGEKDFEERWRTDVHIQFNPVVKSAMQFFDSAYVDLQQPVNFLKDLKNEINSN